MFFQKKMLPDFYHNHLIKIRTLSEYLITLILVKLLNVYREVKLEELANKFPLPIIFASRRKKIMRFLEVPILTIETIWLPIVKAWLPLIFDNQEKVHIVIDRTQWRSINLIMVSLIINKRGIPLYFELLDHTGSSDFELQVKILSQVFSVLKNYQIVVLGEARILFS